MSDHMNRSEVVGRKRLGRSLGQAGRTFFGALISNFRRTVSSPLPRVLFSMPSWQCSRRSPPWCRSMDYLPIQARLASTYRSRRAFCPRVGLTSCRIKSTASPRRAMRRSVWDSLFGLVVALWSANAGMKALMDALNVVYDEKEKRGFVWLNLVSLSLTLAAIVSLLFAIAAVVVLPLLLNYIGLGGMSEMLLQVLRWPALLVLVITGLTVLYRFGPSCTKPRWEWLSVGTVLAAAAWLVASALLSWYLANFANYDATYGSLGAAIGFMMWLWISSIVILFGAELNSEIEHQTACDSTVGLRSLLAHAALPWPTLSEKQLNETVALRDFSRRGTTPAIGPPTAPRSASRVGHRKSTSDPVLESSSARSLKSIQDR